jgi:hypothetical protein
LEEKNYKLVIVWLWMQENKDWELSFSNIRWYILIK